MELLIDTSTRYAAVGLSRNGQTVVEVAWRSERNHSIELVPAINRALDHAGVEVRDVNAVFVASGPGGFSALRVGMSTAKALASSLDVPLVTVGTLDLEIDPYSGLPSPICAIMSASRTRLYVGKKSPEDAGITADLQQLDEFLENLSPDTIYCGEAVPELRTEILARIGPEALLSRAMPPTRRPSALARLGFSKLQAGCTADPAVVEPLYLRSSQISSAARRWAVRT